MRARMALVSAEIQCEVYEIDFKNKPQAMLTASPKGTVPVLILNDRAVIEESLDIVYWALNENDPDGWLDVVDEESLIDENDGSFKAALDRYKYPNRFPDEDCSNARDNGEAFLNKLNNLIKIKGCLLREKPSITDICIFPFVRQFANVDRGWFDSLDLPELQNWLQNNLDSDLFKHIIKKHKQSPYMLL